MKTAMIPGSYDPITLGHMDLVERAKKVFDRVYVVLMVNPDKKCLLTLDERLDIIRRIYEDDRKVTVDVWEGMLFEYARKINPCAIIKGIRNETDLEMEIPQAVFNRERCGVDTYFLTASEKTKSISSTLARSLAKEKLDLSEILHPYAAEKLNEKIKNGGK